MNENVPRRATAIALVCATAMLLPSNAPGAVARGGTPAATDSLRASIRITSPGEPGDRLIVTGRIADSRGHPVAGAALSVYHADASGAYAKPGGANPRLTGTVRVGADGVYRIETVVPSQIRNLEGGSPHIHGTAWVDPAAGMGFVVNLTLAPGRHRDAAQRAAAGDRRSMSRTIVQDNRGTWWLVYDPRVSVKR